MTMVRPQRADWWRDRALRVEEALRRAQAALQAAGNWQAAQEAAEALATPASET